MRLANTAGGTLEARWSMAVLRLARVVMPSRLSRPIRDVGCWCWPAFLPGNSQRGSARVRAAPKGLAIGSAVTSRSEEHTSELQSLMRISYAVFCLKKKKNTAHTNHTLSTANQT